MHLEAAKPAACRLKVLDYSGKRAVFPWPIFTVSGVSVLNRLAERCPKQAPTGKGELTGFLNLAFHIGGH